MIMQYSSIVPLKINVKDTLVFTPGDPRNPTATLPGTCFIYFKDNQGYAVTKFVDNTHKLVQFRKCEKVNLVVTDYFKANKW